MTLPPVPVAASEEERVLAAAIAVTVQAGQPQQAADRLATALQRAYDNGFRDGWAAATVGEPA